MVNPACLITDNGVLQILVNWKGGCNNCQDLEQGFYFEISHLTQKH